MMKSAVVACLMFCCMSALLAVSPSDASSYLAANHVVLSLDDDVLPDFSFLVCSDYQVFLAGESHVYQKSYGMKKAMLQYLHQNAGVRYLLLEDGFCTTLLLEKYLQTGDLDILDDYMFQTRRSIAGYVQEMFDFMVWLFEYNQRLSESERIHVVGLDIDHQNVLALKGLRTLYREDMEPDSNIADAVRRMRIGAVTAPDVLRDALEQYPESCEAYFGKTLPWLENALVNLTVTAESKTVNARAGTSQNDFRDYVMWRNFQFVYGQIPDGKFFGQFGSEHIYRKACQSSYSPDDDVRFGMLLDSKDSPVAGKVCTILYIYMFGDGRQSVPAGGYINYESLHDYQGQDILFDLTAVDSPFAKEELLLKGNGTGGVTTDYFQKLVLLSDSPYNHPYRPHQ